MATSSDGGSPSVAYSAGDPPPTIAHASNSHSTLGRTTGHRPVRSLPARQASESGSHAGLTPMADGVQSSHGPLPTSTTGGADGLLFPQGLGTYNDHRATEFEGSTRFDGHHDDHDDRDGHGEGGAHPDDWDDGFHLTTTSLPKKRKIPTHPNPSPHSPAPINNKAPNSLHANYSTSPSSLVRSAPASEHFPSFPSLHRGYTHQPPTTLPHPTPLPFHRASPACRAFLWSKAVWAERKRMLSGRICLEADGGEGWLAPDEEKAVEFGGSVWGKGWEDGGESISADESLAWGRRRKRVKFGAADGMEGGSGAMKGVRELITPDGLSVTCVVKEDKIWFGGRKTMPLSSLEQTTFTFDMSDSPATIAYDRNNRLLASLRNRLHLYTTNYKSSAPPVGADTESTSGSPADSDSRKTLAPTSKHHPDTYINVGTQTSDKPPREDDPTSGKIITPRPLPKDGKRTAAGSSPAKVLTRKDSLEASAVKPPKPKRDDVVESIEPQWDGAGAGAGGGTGAAHKKKGKKKRSALANASNPHHAKNYVPTRLLSEQPPAPVNPDSVIANLLFPPPTRFLSAQPRRSRSSNAQPHADDPPSDEYLCVFCSYDLFYGTSDAKRKIVEKRKKTLARRRRAKERASGVANGTAKAAKKTKGAGGKKANMRSRGVGDDGVDDDEYRPEGNCAGVGSEDGDEPDCDEEDAGGGECRCPDRRNHETKDKQGQRKKGKIKLAEVDASIAVGPAQTASA